MAIGDVVNGMSAVSSVFTFQPAISVEVLISYIFRATAEAYGLFDGATWAYDNPPIGDSVNIKMFINNSIYLKINAVGGGGVSGYSGIQIK
tara:strand:+ start:229 stop:501 length:273 start_codon:yes stop_codon:yes gene_type:complete